MREGLFSNTNIPWPLTDCRLVFIAETVHPGREKITSNIRENFLDKNTAQTYSW
jgi:hypothetical protein